MSHCWSLSVEEQFYIVWSSLFIWISRKESRARIILPLIALAPVLRLVTPYMMPEMADRIPKMFHTRYDSMLIGCFLAIKARDSVFQERMRRLCSKGIYVAFYAGVILFLSHVTSRMGSYQNLFRDVIEYPLVNIAIAMVVWRGHHSGGQVFDRIVGWSPLRYMGRISFSLYLWQQLFCDPTAPNRVSLPVAFVLALVCAHLSYRWIEMPFLRLKHLIGGPGQRRAAVSRAA